MKYPYFRGLEADRYSFYRVPKALIKVDLFEKMSGDAKLLYAVLLDRMNLSLKNGWQDENGNAYIICTIDEIMDSIRCARQKAVKLLDELEHEYQLIERRRQGLGKPNLLYVKDLYVLVAALTALGTVLLPRLSFYYSTGESHKLKKLLGKSMHFTALTTIPAVLFFNIISREAVLFLGGEQYLPSVACMRIVPAYLYPDWLHRSPAGNRRTGRCHPGRPGTESVRGKHTVPVLRETDRPDQRPCL